MVASMSRRGNCYDNAPMESDEVPFSGFHQGQRQNASLKVRVYDCNLYLLKIID